MNKLLLLFILSVCLFAKSIGQSFPHLNASTGNTGEFIVDSDSNIIMFHNNRIEKLDKNFNPIWVKSYSGLLFKNVLLSKTGSLFFIAYYANVAATGKIDATGNLSWCKSLPTYTFNSQVYTINQADQLLLDRNDQLVITGIATSLYFLKLDTLGSFIKLRLVNNSFLINPYNSTIINDVAGVYHISSWGYGFEGPVYNLTHRYYDLGNTIAADSLFEIGNMGSTGQYPSSNEQIIKSKMQSDVFYLSNNRGAFSSTLYNTFSFRKIKNSSMIWGIGFQTSSPYVMSLQNVEEDHFKNTYLSISTANIYTQKHDKWIVKVDSSGACDNQKYNYLQNFGKASLGEDSITQLKHHYGNTFFYSIETSGSLPGPLSITRMDSTIGSYCTSAASIAVGSGAYYQYQSGSIGHSTLTSVPSVTMQAVSSVTVSSVTTFSANITSCIVLNTKELDQVNTIAVYPSPATTEIRVSASENYAIEQLSIFDVNGKCVLISDKQQTIDVSKLNTGIYFLKIRTDQGEFSQKFIKE